MPSHLPRHLTLLAALLAAPVSGVTSAALAQSPSVTFGNADTQKGGVSLTVSRGLNRSQSSLTYLSTGREYGYEDERAGQYGKRIKAGNTTDASKRSAFERGYQEGVAKARAERDGTVTVADPAELKRNNLIFMVLAGVITAGVLGAAVARSIS